MNALIIQKDGTGLLSPETASNISSFEFMLKTVKEQYDDLKARILQEMEESGRYPDDAILKGRGYVLIEEDAFRDYLKNRKALKQGFMPTPYRRELPEEEVFVIGGTQCL